MNRMKDSLPNMDEVVRQEREFPLRQGGLIRTEEGILLSRSYTNSIPLLTAPEVEIDEVLDAYGDSLERERLLIEEREQKDAEIERLTELLRHEKVQSSGWESEYKKLINSSNL